MAPKASAYEGIILRSICDRMSNLHVRSLRRLAPQLGEQLLSCRSFIESSAAPGQNGESEASKQVHRLKTRISSLLQHRDIEGCMTGVSFVDYAVETAPTVMLSTCGAAWVRSIVMILRKPYIAVAKRICIKTLNSIFSATLVSSALVREVATPNLPAFLAECLQLTVEAIKNADLDLLDEILTIISSLVADHPNVLRTYEKQIATLTLPYLAPCPSDEIAPEAPRVNPHEDTCKIARRLFVLLSRTAPAKGVAAAWEVKINLVITATHETTDRVFRSVVEDWTPEADYKPAAQDGEAISTKPARVGVDSLGLHGWSGLVAGSERIIGLLHLLDQFFAGPSHSNVGIPLGKVVDLLGRLCSVTRPPNLKDWETDGRADPRFERKEREELAIALPAIHAAALGHISVILTRLGAMLTPMLDRLLHILVWVFESERDSLAVRKESYIALNLIITHIGLRDTPNDARSVIPIISACCEELVPTSGDDSALTEVEAMQSVSTAKSKSNRKRDPQALSVRPKAPPSEARGQAWRLLPILLSKLKPQAIPKQLRAKMERTAILSEHRDAMLASVINPSLESASILPILARMFPDDLYMQAVLHPRFAPFWESQQPSENQDKTATAGEVEEDQDQDVSQKTTHSGTDDLSTQISPKNSKRGNRKVSFNIDEADQQEMSKVVASSPHATSESGSSVLEQTVVRAKRPAEAPDSETDAKRKRIGPAVPAEPVDGADAQSQGVVSDGQTPTGDQPARRSTAVHPAEELPSAVSAATAAGDSSAAHAKQQEAELDSEDDDEDFVIPPLTMRHDSDESD